MTIQRTYVMNDILDLIAKFLGFNRELQKTSNTLLGDPRDIEQMRKYQ